MPQLKAHSVLAGAVTAQLNNLNKWEEQPKAGQAGNLPVWEADRIEQASSKPACTAPKYRFGMKRSGASLRDAVRAHCVLATDLSIGSNFSRRRKIALPATMFS